MDYFDSVISRSWQDIVDSVDSDQIPVSCLKRVSINLLDGKRKQINIAKYRKQGYTEEELEDLLGKYFVMLNSVIKNVDFVVDINAVEALVTPITQKLLAKI